MAQITRLPLRSAISSAVKSPTLPARSLPLTAANGYATHTDMPYIQGTGYAPETSDFEFPSIALSKAPNREIGLDMAKTYSRALRKHGICGIELGWADPNSEFLIELVKRMGGKADGAHLAPIGDTTKSAPHSITELVRKSNSATEEQPTRFFGFHIGHPSQKGEGVFRLLCAEHLMQLLSPRAIEILTTHEYNLKASPESSKDKKTIKGKLLQIDPKTGRAYVSYRKDILQDPPSKDRDACAAVEELANLLDSPENVGERIPEFAFKDNTIVLMDNARCLHSQRHDTDPDRWLRKVRFHGYQGSTMSVETKPIPASAFA